MKQILVRVKSGKIPTWIPEGPNKTKKDDMKIGIYDLDGLRRKVMIPDLPTCDEPIQFSSLSNIVHVLMGLRPVSSRRHTFMERNTDIDKIVSKGLFRYLNTFCKKYTTKDGYNGVSYYKEITQGKKAFNDANMRISTIDKDNKPVDGYITWSTMHKRSVYSEGYKYLIDELTEVGNQFGYDDVEKEISLIDLLYEIKKFPELSAHLYTRSKKLEAVSPIGNYLVEGKSGQSINSAKSENLAALTENKYPLYKVSIDGEMVLFMDDKYADMIEKGPKCATFLDGGIATVESVDYVDDVDYDDKKEALKSYMGFKNIK